MLSVVCIKWGDKYPAKYVNVLYNSVIRNLNTDFKFFCLTEDPTGIDEEITTLPLLGGLSGWWNKLSLFRPNTYPFEGDVLFLDLDLVIVNSIDDYATYSKESRFVGLCDFANENRLNSSVFRYTAGWGAEIWDKYLSGEHLTDGRLIVDGVTYNTDQNLIDEFSPQTRFPSLWTISWKWGKNRLDADETKIIAFHGSPNPHEVSCPIITRSWV